MEESVIVIVVILKYRFLHFIHSVPVAQLALSATRFRNILVFCYFWIVSFLAMTVSIYRHCEAERIHNTMKNELLKDVVFHNIEEVKSAIAVAVDFYNSERPYMSIDMMTPREAAVCSGEIDKK